VAAEINTEACDNVPYSKPGEPYNEHNFVTKQISTATGKQNKSAYCQRIACYQPCKDTWVSNAKIGPDYMEDVESSDKAYLSDKLCRAKQSYKKTLVELRHGLSGTTVFAKLKDIKAIGRVY
jgi:hypothetical protein